MGATKDTLGACLVLFYVAWGVLRSTFLGLLSTSWGLLS